MAKKPPKVLTGYMIIVGAQNHKASFDPGDEKKLAERLLAMFPGGFTIVDAMGHWRNYTGQEGQLPFQDYDERSKMLVLMLDADQATKIEAFCAVISNHFRQKAVGFITLGQAMMYNFKPSSWGTKPKGA